MLEFDSQTDESDLVLFKAQRIAADGERHRAVLIARERARELLASVARLVGLERDGRAHEALEVAGALERCEFTVRNGWNYRGEEEYPSRFVRTVNAMRGVYDCRVIHTDNVSRSIRVEVIYERDMFPEGFINSLYTIRELDLYR